MSVARSSTCVFCTFKQATKRQAPKARRRFHLSVPVRSSKGGKEDQSHPVDDIKPLTKEQIKQHYTPEQAAAIKAAQSNLKFDDEFTAFTRQDRAPWKMRYMQNMTEIDPVVDKPVKQPWSNLDDNSRLKTEDEFADDIVNLVQNMPRDEAAAGKAVETFLKTNRITVGKESAEYAPRSATAPESPPMYRDTSIPNIGEASTSTSTSPSTGAGQKRNAAVAEGTEEISPALVRLLQMTGLTKQAMTSLRVKSIVSHRVVNQTRMGKIDKVYWLSIAGNQNGLLGIGEGKSEDAAEGMIQSQYRAIRNLAPIMRYENRTIYGDVKGKSGATELELYTRPPGFGLRCQQYIFEMCRCAGIHDLAARVTRARNPMNTVKAAFQALKGQKDPEEIAKGRGKKMVDVRKVYYAGNV